MAKKGEVVAVTGASASISRAVVEQFARRDARIGLIAQDQDHLQAKFEQLGGEVLALYVDVADADTVEESSVGSEFGRLTTGSAWCSLV